MNRRRKDSFARSSGPAERRKLVKVGGFLPKAATF
jgi:hypothetical protein